MAEEMIKNSKYTFSFNEKYDNEVGDFRKTAEQGAGPLELEIYLVKIRKSRKSRETF